MLKIKVNEEKEFTFSKNGDQVILNSEVLTWNISELVPGEIYHILKDNRSYNVEVISKDEKAKNLVLKINNQIQTINIKDEGDILLEKSGIKTGGNSGVSELKAPMPGLIIAIPAEKGQTVKKGDPLIILEAMKMENVLKATADGVIGSIEVQQGQGVDKNQVLIRFAK